MTTSDRARPVLASRSQPTTLGLVGDGRSPGDRLGGSNPSGARQVGDRGVSRRRQVEARLAGCSKSSSQSIEPRRQSSWDHRSSPPTISTDKVGSSNDRPFEKRSNHRSSKNGESPGAIARELAIPAQANPRRDFPGESRRHQTLNLSELQIRRSHASILSFPLLWAPRKRTRFGIS